MSEETARRLREARARASQASGEADNRKRELLDTIARDLPARVESRAKSTAQAQPEVTKALGKDGIKKFRSELLDQATELATEIRAAADQIKWPMPLTTGTSNAWVMPAISPVKSREIHSALFEFLHGRRCDTLAAILKRHGFNIEDDNAQRSQGLILPQTWLYSEREQVREFEALAEALTALAKEREAVKEAQAVHDREVVDSLWEDD
ncbi:hypothetical protein [Micromonospora costi]|nr:hypothetical protein [Micromonospora costi]